MTNLETRPSPRGGVDGPTDAVLLARWGVGNDPAAIDTIVRRHGGLVLGVCRRVLGNTPDAEDAFQATFLVLVRKGAALNRPGHLAGWLHAVAFRVARKARAARARRREREVALVDIPDPSAAIHPDTGDLRRTIDEELDRLPEKYRLPIVLCELEGRTLDEAARMLGWPMGTVAGRLSRGRDLLRRRLSRRGIGLPLFLPVGLSGAESVTPPEPLVASTITTAAGGMGAAGPPAMLARQVIRDDRYRRGLFALLLLVAVLLAALGLHAGAAIASASTPTEPVAPSCGCHDSTS